jgi:hypothetical protein
MFDFDTLRYANELKAAGVPEKQAEVQAHKFGETIKGQNEAISDWIGDSLATKRDLKELELKLNLKIENIKKDIIIQLGSLMVGCFGMLATLIVIFQK